MKKKVTFGERSAAAQFFAGQLDPEQERMLGEVVVAAVNEGRFYPSKPKQAVQAAIKDYIKFKTEGMRDNARVIEKAAVKEVNRQWRSR